MGYEKGEDNMLPVIDNKKTGIHLRRIMDEHGLSVKDVQQYLGLAAFRVFITISKNIKVRNNKY